MVLEFIKFYFNAIYLYFFPPPDALEEQILKLVMPVRKYTVRDGRDMRAFLIHEYKQNDKKVSWLIRKCYKHPKQYFPFSEKCHAKIHDVSGWLTNNVH